MPTMQKLSLEEFRLLLATELQLDPALVKPEASFVEDLLVDSIRMVDLLMRLEEMGMVLPLEDMWDVRTVEDAYRVYAQAVGET
ncbi:MAG TPA: phosphopantetheine-binding protein [Anaerolineae bacterium]|nr:phosphopantetheine-binding protein [Anaerolineae bacterium]HOR00332.1 phosphopantetheine-binding protein [Anaerolineae bacterium]